MKSDLLGRRPFVLLLLAFFHQESKCSNLAGCFRVNGWHAWTRCYLNGSTYTALLSRRVTCVQSCMWLQTSYQNIIRKTNNSSNGKDKAVSASKHHFVKNYLKDINCTILFTVLGWGCLRIGGWEEYLGLRGMKWQGIGDNCIMRSLMICILITKYFPGDKIHKKKIGEICSACGGKGETYTRF